MAALPLIALQVPSAPVGTPAPPLVDIANRKYLGSKVRLLDFIEQAILSQVPRIHSFADFFAGTGVVAHRLRPAVSSRVIVNDFLPSNYVVLRAFFASTARTVSLPKLEKLLRALNRLPGLAGYVSRAFGGRYFTRENARAIDAVREAVDQLHGGGRITEQERCVLLASLVFACDKVANTCGQYDAYLKHLGRAAYDSRGRHLVDASAYAPLRLRLPRLALDQPPAAVYREDANAIAARVAAQVVYLDPPYNTRQYADNYHVLDNIVEWKKPPLFGKTKKYDRGGLRSAYSKRSGVAQAFRELIERLQCDHIFLSYNSEGLLAQEEIMAVMGARGPVACVERDYGVFGNGAGVARKRRVVERLYHCKVRSA